MKCQMYVSLRREKDVSFVVRGIGNINRYKVTIVYR